MIIDESQKRDAIHLAVIPVVAGEDLWPGQRAQVTDGVARFVRAGGQGIVDPFLSARVLEGARFWFVIDPRKITSLRHVWSHPDFPDEAGPAAIVSSEPAPVTQSWAWIDKFADDIDQTRNRLMEAADLWVEDEDYTYDNSERYKDHWDKFPEFWKHYEIVRGVTVKDKEASFFTCSC